MTIVCQKGLIKSCVLLFFNISSPPTVHEGLKIMCSKSIIIFNFAKL